jgi:branched-chain amino acid transport system permease protein
LEGFIQALVLGLAFGGVYALVASGLTLIFAVTRHINIAHGSFMILTMYILFVLYSSLGIDPYLGMLICIPVMFILGIIVFLFILRPVVKAEPLVVFQMLIGVSFVVENALLVYFGGDLRVVTGFIVLSKVDFGPIVVRTSQLVAFIASIAVSIGFFYLLEKTEFGRSIRAVAQDSDVAGLMGINVRTIQMLVFALGFVLLAIAASLVIPFQTFHPLLGLFATLFGSIILVMGGMGSFLGALIVSLGMGVIYGLSLYYIHSAMATTVCYGIFILFLLIKPQGLFGVK